MEEVAKERRHARNVAAEYEESAQETGNAYRAFIGVTTFLIVGLLGATVYAYFA